MTPDGLITLPLDRIAIRELHVFFQRRAHEGSACILIAGRQRRCRAGITQVPAAPTAGPMIRPEACPTSAPPSAPVIEPRPEGDSYRAERQRDEHPSQRV